MRRTIALAGLVAPVVIAAAGCSSCAAPILACTADAECPRGTSCDRKSGACVSSGVGGEGEGEGVANEGEGEGEGVVVDDAPVIRAIDGSGSALPVVGAGPNDAVAARHRIRETLVVTGAHFDGVTSASLVRGSERFDLSFNVEDGAHMRLRLPHEIRPGLFALTLASAAGSAHAEVFLLQGEPGPPAAPPIIEPSTADAAVCPSGGVHYAIGVDANQNGLLDPGEENVALARDVCNGDSIFACDATTQTCTTTNALVAPTVTATTIAATSSLTVNALPAKAHVTTPQTINVPADAATVGAAIARFNDVILDADVNIVVAPGVHDEPNAIVMLREDGVHFRISGASSATTTLRFTNQTAFQADHDGQIGSIAQITLLGNDNVNTNGVVALNGARIHTGADVVIAHFGNGVIALRNAEIEAAGVVTTNNANGVASVDGSYVDATGATSSSNSNAAFVANVGSIIEASSCIAGGNGNGVSGAAIEAINESVVIGTSCTLGGNTLAVFAANESYVAVDRAVFGGNATNFNVSTNSSARRDLASGDPTARTFVDSTSTVLP